MDNNILFIEDDQQEINQKAKMYYHLCCGGVSGDDFDDSRINTRLSFYEQDGFIGTFVKVDDKYIGFIVSKSVQGADEYIKHNYGYNLLKQELGSSFEETNLDTINYIDGLFIDANYRRQGLGIQLLQYHESITKSKGYQYSMLEYNTTEKPYLLNFYVKNGYNKLFDYMWTHGNDSSKTKQKTLMIKKI